MTKRKKDLTATRLTKQQAENWLRDHDGLDVRAESVVDERVIEINHGRLWVDLEAKNGRPRILVAARPFEPNPQPLFEFAISLALDDKTKIALQESDADGKTLLVMQRDDAGLELFFDKKA